MTLVTMHEMLAQAKREQYAVGSFDLINMEFAEAIVAGAVAQRSPVILSTAAVHFDYVNMSALAPSLVRLAQEAPVPVALHLDHGTDLAMAVQAIRLGFTSVQIDTAHYPFADNVRLTREIVQVCRAVGVSVEGELGYVSGHEGDHGSRYEEERPIYTEPEEAAAFVEQTGVDCLAVSVGTIHGLMKGEPQIDFTRLQQIRDKTAAPLVIHGGSGLSVETYQQLVNSGMSKINYYAELSKGAVQAIRVQLAAEPQTTSITRVLGGVRAAVQEIVEEKIKIWGSNDKA